jgi:DNA-directed RNA polymerase subunit H
LKKLNVLDHELVPKHTILNEQEKEEVLKKYGVSLRQLPRMLITDPAVSEMNPKVGDVVKIIRKGQTAGESVYFRVVIKG